MGMLEVGASFCGRIALLHARVAQTVGTLIALLVVWPIHALAAISLLDAQCDCIYHWCLRLHVPNAVVEVWTK